MEMNVQDVERGATLIVLRGRLDREGASAIESRFNDLAGSQKPLIVDLSEVTYIASMGMRMFLVVGKTIVQHGGKMVLMAPSPDVAGVLKTAGIYTAIPVRATLDDALAAFALA